MFKNDFFSCKSDLIQPRLALSKFAKNWVKSSEKVRLNGGPAPPVRRRDAGSGLRGEAGQGHGGVGGRQRGAPPALRRVPGLVERFDIEPFSDFSAQWANFIGLFLFCIAAKFCKKIFVGKLLTRSTRFTCFCAAQTSIFQQNCVNFFFSFFGNKFQKLCKGLHHVDLGESFPTNIFLQNLASIQPRTSPVRFALSSLNRTPRDRVEPFN